MLDKNTSLKIFQTMWEIRDFEETAWTLFTENKLRGSVHLYTGEEAVAAAVCAQLTDEDYIASTHRGHGHALYTEEACKIMCELSPMFDAYYRNSAIVFRLFLEKLHSPEGAGLLTLIQEKLGDTFDISDYQNFMRLLFYGNNPYELTIL